MSKFMKFVTVINEPVEKLSTEIRKSIRYLQHLSTIPLKKISNLWNRLHHFFREEQEKKMENVRHALEVEVENFDCN